MVDAHSPLYVDLKEYFDRLLLEHDRRYEQRFAAIEQHFDTALLAQEKAVAAAAQATKIAIDKAQLAQDGVNIRGNEFRASLDDYTKQMIPRREAEQQFAAFRKIIDELTEQVNLLRRGESRGLGGSDTAAKIRQQLNWFIGLIIVSGLNLLGLLVALFSIFGK